LKNPRKGFLNHTDFVWGLAGIAFVSLSLILAAGSSDFSYDRRNIDKPILSMVVLLTTSGVFYLWLILRFKQISPGKFWSGGIIFIGLLARFILFLSTPILEDDYYRYLWDGGMVAHGVNPYLFSVQEVLEPESRHVPERLSDIAKEARPIPNRVNHPWLKTIYPPISQIAFAFAHLLSPWNLTGWRLVLLTADLFTLYLLFLLLRRLNLPPTGLVVYWWNPLLIKEAYNSGHMDLLLLPFILGGLLFSIQRRYVAASVTLGLGVGIKFWPAILFPAVLRPLLREPKRFLPPLLAFSSLALVMFLPFLITGLDSSSGLLAYLSHWEMNDSLFLLLLWVVQFIIRLLNLDVGYAPSMTRIAAAGIFFVWVFWLLRKPGPQPNDSISRFLLITAGLFLLSPAQFPWYYLWLLPLLALQLRVSLLLFTGLLPLSYLRFYFDARGWVGIFDTYLVWLQFVPVWLLLIWEWQKAKKVLIPGEAVGYARKG
jgi:alpha-1,6-mannosyltransferase